MFFLFPLFLPFQLERLSCAGFVRPTLSLKSRIECSRGTLKTCTMLKRGWRLNWEWMRNEPRLFTNTCWPLNRLWSAVCQQFPYQVSSPVSLIKRSVKVKWRQSSNVLKCTPMRSFCLFLPHTTNTPVILLKISQITPEYVTFDTRVSFYTGFQRTGGMRVFKLFGLSYFVFLNRYRRDSFSWKPGFISESSQWSAGGKPTQASCTGQPALWSSRPSGQVSPNCLMWWCSG